ncbi:LysR family transcriptional regulator [Variovorax sp. IB41]|nr:LysR substrate-binding domain-containing protein [Variovorax sp. IB41]MBJ2155184.1 LysR family transcriptional regulator [Variovorax sp. IB41]
MSHAVLDPELLKTFVTVSEQRSFTRAAAQLNRTQSAVSMQVKRLEELLGTALFARTTSQVALTPSGEALLGYAHRILALHDEAVGRIRQHQNEGQVRLGIMDDYGTSIVPPLLASFGQRYPRIRVSMETGLTAKMTERLGEDFDLVIAMHPKGQGGGDFLRQEQAVWAAAPDHVVDAQAPLSVALYPSGCLFREWAMAALDKARRPWRLAFVSHSSAAVEAVVAQGLAVSVFKAGTFPKGLRALSRDDGMPRLPQAGIRLHRAPALTEAGALLASHLVAGIRRDAGAANGR